MLLINHIRIWEINIIHLNYVYLGNLRHALTLPSPAYRIHPVNCSTIYAQSKSSIFKLKTNDVYTFFRSFPSHITSLGYCSTSHIVILTTTRMLAIIDTTHCDIINALWIVESLGKVKQVILLEQYYRIFVLTDFGNILIGNTQTFPIATVDIWKGICFFSKPL